MIQQITVHQIEQMVTYVLLDSHKCEVKQYPQCQWSKFSLFLTTNTTFVHVFHPCYHAKIAWLSFSRHSHIWKNLSSKVPQRCSFCWPNFSVATTNSLCKDFHHQDKKPACSVEVWLKKKCIKKQARKNKWS